MKLAKRKDGRVEVSFGQARWLFLVAAAPATETYTLVDQISSIGR